MASVEKNIYQYFEAFAAEQGQARFLFDENRTYSAKEAFGEAVTLGNRLYDLGIRQGSLAVLRCTRSLDAYLIFLALEFLGATAVLTDPHLPVDAFLQDSGIPLRPDLIITNEAAGQGIAANGNWEIPGHGSLTIGYPGRQEPRRFPTDINRTAPAAIVFTSGSTGKGKGAMLSQEAILQYAVDSVQLPWHRKEDVAIVTIPTQHGFGLCLLGAALVARYALFFPRDIHVDYVLDCIERYRITRINAVPSYFYVLARSNELCSRNLDSLQTGFTAGAPMVPEQHRYIERILGITLHPLYGMSESISISCTAPADSAECRANTVGRFHRDAGCILDPQGNPVPQGVEGEICVSGPAIMCGYYGDEEATRQAIDAQGRLHTGDLGYLDAENYLHISGRIKDIIIRNGINLSPAKIEAAIRSVPGVEHTAVVGVRHEMLGEAPCALVVLKAGCSMTAEELKQQLLPRISKNAIPVAVLFTDRIPLNKIGKPDKPKIKELFRG
jgi:acyl-CoA synthetase (AMP-forming)/AMP-acid ligase II